MKHIIFHSFNQFYITIDVLTTCLTQIYAQTESSPDQSQYLIPEFLIGRVKMKTGIDLTLNLNYNTISEAMAFLQNGQIYNMTNLEMVDTVYPHDRKFVPIEKAFYEVILDGPVPFLSSIKASLQHPVNLQVLAVLRKFPQLNIYKTLTCRVVI